jgi:hypothetical protein
LLIYYVWQSRFKIVEKLIPQIIQPLELVNAIGVARLGRTPLSDGWVMELRIEGCKRTPDRRM